LRLGAILATFGKLYFDLKDRFPEMAALA
jgi:hypothetical protein